MRNKSFFIALFLLIRVVSWSQENFVTQLKQTIIPLSTVEAGNGFEDLHPLREVFKDVHIVGAGEATHGTREFFQVRHRLFEFLVLEMDFKVFVIEGYFVGTEKANNYVKGEEINPYEAVMSMGFGVWYTEEMLDLLNWMRDYNVGKTESEKLSIYGCDMQGYKETAVRMQEVLEANGLLTDNIKEGLTRLATKETREYLSKSDLKRLSVIVDQIEALLKSSSMPNKPTLLQYNRILQQYLTQAGAKSRTYVDLRDQFMAENVKWIDGLEGGKKIFLWEHNQHIMKTKDNLGFTPMGHHLQEVYGEAYYALGLCFGSGTFRAANMETQKFEDIKLQTQLENSVEEFLAKAQERSFMIDFPSLEKSQALNTHFQKSFRMKSFGEIFSPKRERFYYSESVLPKGFDGILYIDQTTGTRGLDLKKVWKE